jgi:hypothetical protein
VTSIKLELIGIATTAAFVAAPIAEAPARYRR